VLAVVLQNYFVLRQHLSELRRHRHRISSRAYDRLILMQRLIIQIPSSRQVSRALLEYLLPRFTWTVVSGKLAPRFFRNSPIRQSFVAADFGPAAPLAVDGKI